jgi:hypothetical protein
LLLVRECWKDYITTVEYLSNYADKLIQVVNQLENGERAWALNELLTCCEPDAEPDFEPTNTGTLTDRQEKTADAS